MSDTIVIGRTGSVCHESGPYRSSGAAGVVVFFKEGDVFPPDVDGTAATWTLVKAAAG